MSEVTTKASASLKRLGIFVAVVVVLGGLEAKYNIIPIRAGREAVVPTAVELPSEAPQQARSAVTATPLPGNNLTAKAGPTVRVNIWAWNAQMGLIFANGGPKTTEGSLMEKHGVKLNLVRQDDTTKSQAEQIKFASRLHDGDPNPGEGTHFVVIMGDGAAQYLAGINKPLSKLGDGYQAEIVGSVGYSGNNVSGEDAFMGPADWRDDPEKMKGGTVIGVLRDGDWNIAMYLAQQNGIKNNPDETTYDPTALNWIAADDYMKAAEMLIVGSCDDRRVVRDGKLTTEPKHHTCAQAAVTWTPGDVNIAKKKGGVVKLLSTKENAFQMPAVVIGIHKWNVEHAKVVEGFLAAAFEGGDQVRSYDAALQRAGKASAAVYGEETAAYWVRYYKGAVERDKTGIPVPLGGSRASNLGDNLALFGLLEGSGSLDSSMFKATYEGFGNIAKQQYPKLVPSFPKVTEAVNLTFLESLAATEKPSVPELATYEASSAPISDVKAKRNWSITFDSGRATFTPAATTTLNELYSQLVVGKMSIDIEGHTDNQGSSGINVPLSEARASAVKEFLRGKAPALFPDSRINVSGFGDSKPIADNSTPDGRAANRRVVVILGDR